MIKVLHFADAHIDIASHGRRDPVTGLPLRVLDFLKSLDTIIDTAINEKVDLVIFAGDAYKDRTPVPTFQREWGKRIMRLSSAAIPTILLLGNHDISPASGRAHSLQEFETLEIPHVKVIQKPTFLTPDDLEGLPVQIIALPWVTRSAMVAARDQSLTDLKEVNMELENILTQLVNNWLDECNPEIPTILTAHGSVMGAVFGGERSVMLGSDQVLSGRLVKDARIDYVALGHIHKAQNLNEGRYPPVIYPGSIEKVDFGEAKDDKFFVVAAVEKNNTHFEWRKLQGRKFIDKTLNLAKKVEKLQNSSDGENNVQAMPDPDIIQEIIRSGMPSQTAIQDAIVRVTLEYPREWEVLIDEPAIRQSAEPAFEFHLIRKPSIEARIRIPGDQSINSLSPLELLDIYWNTIKVEPNEIKVLDALAKEIISTTQPETTESEEDLL